MALIKSCLAGGSINFDDLSAAYVEDGYNANPTHTVEAGDLLFIFYEVTSLTQAQFEAGLSGATVVIEHYHSDQYHKAFSAVVRATSTTLTCPNDPNVGYPIIIKLTTV